MADKDIARLLPEPPLERPAGRDAAIAAAMRRFDGVPEPAAPPKPARSRSGWSGWRPIGAFASVLLVAVISIPFALHAPGGPIGPSQRPAPPTAERPQAQSIALPDTPPARQTADNDLPPTPKSPIVESRPAAGAPAGAVTADKAEAAAPAKTVEELPPPPPPRAMFVPAPVPAVQAKMAPAAAEPAADEEASIVVTGSRIAPASRANSVVREVRDEDNRTVTRGRRPAASQRGDWNACTVNDPEQSLRGCNRLIDTTGKGPAGAAAARLSEGLTLAWQRDWNGAIAALDQAIALQPRLALAYLNRGLLYQRKGETARAAADLDRAVRYAPHSPLGYYSRSMLRRESGNARGAEADAARAVALDAQYDAIIE